MYKIDCIFEKNNTVTCMGINLDIVGLVTPDHLTLEDCNNLTWIIDLSNQILIEPSGYKHIVKIVNRDHVRNWKK